MHTPVVLWLCGAKQFPYLPHSAIKVVYLWDQEAVGWNGIHCTNLILFFLQAFGNRWYLIPWSVCMVCTLFDTAFNACKSTTLQRNPSCLDVTNILLHHVVGAPAGTGSITPSICPSQLWLLSSNDRRQIYKCYILIYSNNNIWTVSPTRIYGHDKERQLRSIDFVNKKIPCVKYRRNIVSEICWQNVVHLFLISLRCFNTCSFRERTWCRGTLWDHTSSFSKSTSRRASLAMYTTWLVHRLRIFLCYWFILSTMSHLFIPTIIPKLFLCNHFICEALHWTVMKEKHHPSPGLPSFSIYRLNEFKLVDSGSIYTWRSLLYIPATSWVVTISSL